MPHLREENAYWRLPEFLEFTGRPEYRVLKFLMAHIVRDVKKNFAPYGALRIHRNFYKKGLLCASYSQNDIAKYFGWILKNGKPNSAYVSRLIKRLEKMELLKIHSIPTPGGMRNVYEFGRYKGVYQEEGYEESLYFDLYFSAKVKIHFHEREKMYQLEFLESREQDPPEFIEKLNCQIIDLEKERMELTKESIGSLK